MFMKQTAETMPGVLYPDLSSSVTRQTQTYWREENPTKGHKDYEKKMKKG